MGSSASLPDVSACPSAAILAAYAAGALPAADVDTVATHVGACPICEATLLGLGDQSDTLVSNLRRYLADQIAVRCLVGSAETTKCNEPALAKMVPGSGEQFGQYELLEKLGQGGMGVVFKARQRRPSRLVALKVTLLGGLAGSQAIARFRTEADAVARLEHENIVRIYEAGEHSGRPYFSMEYVAGTTLASCLAGTPYSEQGAAELLRTLARAVHYAHEQKVIHRDLKPANVLLGDGGAVKLADFGLAKLLDADSGQTGTADVMGTASYMAPEQATGDLSAIGPQTDVYGLGAILYETLTGCPPFRGSTRQQTLEQVRGQRPVLPNELRPGLSQGLMAVCLQCLEKKPADRYSSAAALADDLDRWLGGQPTQAKLPAPARRRRRLAYSYAAAACLLYLFVAVQWTFQSADPVLSELARALDSGQPVTLVANTGEPVSFRVRAGDESTRVFTRPDGTFTVHTWDLCLIELLPDPRHDHYQFSAWVRHENSDLWGEVGLYFGHRALSGPQTNIHLLCRMIYNDVRTRADVIPPGVPENIAKNLKTPKENKVRLGAHIYGKQPSHIWDSRLDQTSGAPFQPRGVAGDTWRNLEVVVTPKGITGSRDGQAVGYFPADKVNAILIQWAEAARNRRLEDSLLRSCEQPLIPRGGLGFYVFRGSASFRTAVVTPLGTTK